LRHGHSRVSHPGCSKHRAARHNHASP
jgi:hypothetical protein